MTTHGLQLVLAATNQFTLRAYSDSDWAGNPDDRRSTLGSCLFFGPKLVLWRSKKYALIAQSNTEAECMALAQTTSELLLESLIYELHYLLSSHNTM